MGRAVADGPVITARSRVSRISTTRVLRPADRERAAIGLIEVKGAAAFMLVAKMVIQEQNVALMKPFHLGSATATLVIVGDIESVRRATNKDWLEGPEVLGQLIRDDPKEGEKPESPLIWSHCFDKPSKMQWEIMRELEEIPTPPLDMSGKELTLAVIETERAVPHLAVQQSLGYDASLRHCGVINVGSRRISEWVAGELGAVQAGVERARAHLQALKTQGVIEQGAFSAACVLPLGRGHADLDFLVEWDRESDLPYEDTAGSNSYAVYEMRGLGAYLLAIDRAAKEGRVNPIQTIELGSATATALATSSSVGEVDSAAARELIREDCAGMFLPPEVKEPGDNALLNVVAFHQPLAVFGAARRRPEAVAPKDWHVDMKGKALGVVDTQRRGLLIHAMHVLRDFGVEIIGTKKLGTEQDSMVFAGDLAQVQAAMKAIKERASEELVRKDGVASGKLYSLAVIPNPHEQTLRHLPWPKPAKQVVPASGMVIPNFGYKVGGPLGFIETFGQGLQILLANAVFHEVGAYPVWTYCSGSGLETFYYAHPDHDVLKTVFNRKFLFDFCRDNGIPNAAEMLLNAASFAKPGDPLWSSIGQLPPASQVLINALSAPEQAVGVFTAKGVVPTQHFLYEMRRYEEALRIIGYIKSGGRHITVTVIGPLGDVEDAILLGGGEKREGSITRMMLDLYGPDIIRTWGVVGNPDAERLAFFLREGRGGV